MKTKAEIIKDIKKKNFKIIEDLEDKWLVIWYEKESVKVGLLNKKYIHRYGVETLRRHSGYNAWLAIELNADAEQTHFAGSSRYGFSYFLLYHYYHKRGLKGSLEKVAQDW